MVSVSLRYLCALPLLASVLLTQTTATLFTLSAYLPSSPINGSIINAAGQSFYAGLSAPATYCPTVVNLNCPNVTGTVVAGMSAMWVEVPGGQEIYVNSNGAIGYTQAHSDYIPIGAYQGYFTNVTITSDCAAPVYVINWEAPDNSTQGILACPTASSNPNSTEIYQIYAHTPAFNQTGCVELKGLLPGYLPDGAGFGAWQYT